MTFPELLQRYKRIVICGGPRTGKTTLANQCTDREVIHSDDYQHLPWSEVPLFLLRALKEKPSWILEGVQAARTLRKGLEADAVIWLSEPMTEQSKSHRAMTKGIEKVFNEWRPNSQTTIYTSNRWQFVRL